MILILSSFTACSLCSLVCCCLLLPLLLLSLLLVLSYIPYTIYLHKDADSHTYYIMSLDRVLCAEANSLHYSGIEIEGFLGAGDSLQGTIKSWLLREDHLKPYHYLNPPIVTKGSVTELNNGPVLLSGWQIYTWKTSNISGYCCVSNHNDTDINASLYIFQNDKDETKFFQTGVVKNAILSDTITVQPNRSECFHKWGKAAPFYVEKSAYHYFVLDAPVNTSYSANMTVLEAYVNTSDYTNPKYFRYDNKTYFSISRYFSHPTNFLAICEAPLYVVNDTKLESVSLHIRTTYTPYKWMKPIFITTTVLGGILFLLFCVLLICFLVVICKVHNWYGYLKYGTYRYRSYNAVSGSDSIN